MSVMEDFVVRISQENYQIRVREYCRLASKQELSADLSDEDAERLDEILAEAEEDEILNFWINEADYILGQRLGLLDESHLDDYQNQQAWLREYLEVQNLDNLDYYRRVQHLLRSKGCYDGPVDGVFKKDSRNAVRKFQASKDLEVDGKLDDQTIEHLAKLADTPEDAQRLLAPLKGTYDSEIGGGNG